MFAFTHSFNEESRPMSRTSEEFENGEGRWTHITNLAERFYQPVTGFIREVTDTPLLDGNSPRAEMITMACVCAIIILWVLSYAGILETIHAIWLYKLGIPILKLIILSLDLFAEM